MITPIPNLPATVVGWMNTRNQVLCVVDLPQFLHFEPAVGNHQRYPVIITRFASPSSANPSSANLANPASDQVMLNAQAPPISQVLLLGLVVHQIRGVERLDREQITSPIAKFPESFTPFLQGCVFQPEGTIPVLQMDAIAAASSLQQVMT
jgi:twitching motility protein PilI